MFFDTESGWIYDEFCMRFGFDRINFGKNEFLHWQ